MRQERGSMIVLLLPVSLGLFIWLIFLINVSKAAAVKEKLNMICGWTALSSARLKAESLEILAERWETFGSLLQTGDLDKATINQSDWNLFINGASQLPDSLRGYPGRIAAVATVVAEANGLPRDLLRRIEGEASLLGLASQGLSVVDETGYVEWVEGAWLRREWETTQEQADPSGDFVHTAELQIPLMRVLGVPSQLTHWTLRGRGDAHLVWDVQRHHPDILLGGNGGFPREWASAVIDGRVKPHRYPYFWAKQGEKIEEGQSFGKYDR